jgi:hypothetical protein
MEKLDAQHLAKVSCPATLRHSLPGWLTLHFDTVIHRRLGVFDVCTCIGRQVQRAFLPATDHHQPGAHQGRNHQSTCGQTQGA